MLVSILQLNFLPIVALADLLGLQLDSSNLTISIASTLYSPQVYALMRSS